MNGPGDLAFSPNNTIISSPEIRFDPFRIEYETLLWIIK